VNIFEVNKTADLLKSSIIIMIAILAITSIIQSLFVSSAYALTRYFNYVTPIENCNGTMTLENVKGCYYKVFQDARDADADGNKIR
jgi:hypothetical protein